MGKARLQVILVCVAVLVGAFQSAGGEQSRRLKGECDQLLADAVRRPVGLAWAQDDNTAAGPNDPLRVMLAPLSTPSAGLVLLYAADLLGEPRYSDAALQIARGLAAAQERTGRFPNQATFARTASSRDQSSPCPDRGPTRAALALLCSLVDVEKPDETLRRSAVRGAFWLAQQEPAVGGFPTLYPPEAPANRSATVCRLDTGEYRDCTMAVLLAYESLHDARLRIAAEHSADFLLKIRLKDSKTARDTWAAMYKLNGEVSEQFDEYPRAVDMVATRNALQTLLATYVVLAHEPSGQPLESSAASIEGLRQEDRSWRGRYPLHGDEVFRPEASATRPAIQPTTAASRPEYFDDRSGTFGLEPTLLSLARLKADGREKYRQALDANLDYKHHLALAAAGLLDDPMTLALPATLKDARAFIAGRPELRTAAENPAGDMPLRVRRLWVRYFLARAESLESTTRPAP